MKDLFLAELRRFRTAALLFALGHLLLQLVVGRIYNLLEMRYQAHLVGLAAFMACGLAFGLYQFGTWRQTGRWIWLIHRPLPPLRIFAALAGASILLIVLAVGVPALAALLVTRGFTARVVDLRHYTLVAHLVLLTVIAWLAGTHIILSRSRAAALVLVLPAVMVGHLASGALMLIPACACVALLAFAAYGSFKPDRREPPRSLAMTCATAFPLQLGFYLALAFGISVLYQVIQMAAGVHPLSNPDGAGYFDLINKTGKQNIERALALSEDPRVAHWREELGPVKVGFIRALERQYAVRGQASNLDSISFADPDHRTLWTFSHDAMRFHGRDLLTGADRGWIGLRGAGDRTPFPAVPIVAGPDTLIAPQQFYQIDLATQRVRQPVALSGDEVLGWPARASAPPAGAAAGRVYTLTNQRLIAHQGGAGGAANDWSVALPGPASDLGRIDIADLPDGSLLSFDYGLNMMNGAPGSMQTLMFVDTAGHAQVISQRPLVHDFGLFYEHRDWWLSPVLQAVAKLPELVLDKGMVLDKGETHYLGNAHYPRPQPVVIGTLLLAVLSALGAHLWLRGAPLPARGKAGWIVACLLLGLPALLGLMALQPRQLRQPMRTAAQPAAA